MMPCWLRFGARCAVFADPDANGEGVRGEDIGKDKSDLWKVERASGGDCSVCHNF